MGAITPGRAAAGAGGQRRTVTLCLCGDVMTGRGLDQVLPHAGDPRLYETWADSALRYVELAERANGRIARPVDLAYPWGDALTTVARAQPDAWIANLETAVTRHDEPAPKGINYRMHPGNVGCLGAVGVDCWVLANNHVIDWGRPGLRETLDTLHDEGLRTAGAGRDLAEAEAPVAIPLPGGGRILVFAVGSTSSGIPRSWAAGVERPGVNLLEATTLERIAARVQGERGPGDVVVVSIHWGGNWGYDIPARQTHLARGLVDAGVDVVHGHSSHHRKGIEVYGGRAILYGCGDFLNDYEGIEGHEEYRDELVLLYFATLDPDEGSLLGLEMVPFRIARFRLNEVSAEETAWLRQTLHEQCVGLGTRVELAAEGRLALRWR